MYVPIQYPARDGTIMVVGISGDGSTIIINYAGGGDRFDYTNIGYAEANKFNGISVGYDVSGLLENPNANMAAVAISADGLTIAGSYSFFGGGYFVENSGIYTNIADPNAIPSPRGSYSWIVALSANGQTVAGNYRDNTTGNTLGFSDTEGNYTTIQYPSSNKNTQINAISGDGTTVVGIYYVYNNSYSEGFVEKNGIYQNILYPDNGGINGSSRVMQTEVTAVSNNGAVVAGDFAGFANGYTGFIYDNGNYTAIRPPDGYSDIRVTGISGDGSTVVGWMSNDDQGRYLGFVWKNGQFSIVDDPTESRNIFVTSISADGSTVAGYSENYEYLDQQGFIATDPFCFMSGTLIATPSGCATVETLQTGDQVKVHAGQVHSIRWIGRQTVSRRFADPLRVLPIRIKAGALAENLPERDLLLSPAHAILINDVLVHASALVNGSTIVRETDVPETFIYYHVELEDHALVLAEGVPAETFIDNESRERFDNWDEHLALCAEASEMQEMLYPRALCARQVPMEIRRQLALRASALSRQRIRAA